MALEKKNLEESFSMYGTCYIVLPKWWCSFSGWKHKHLCSI